MLAACSYCEEPIEQSHSRSQMPHTVLIPYTKLGKYCWFSFESPVETLKSLDALLICCSVNVLKQNKAYGSSLH